MKIYITLLALCITYNCAAMQPQLIREVTQGPIVTRRAELANEEGTGTLLYVLTHNTATDTYSGTMTNNNYDTLAEWHDQVLTPEEAEEEFRGLDHQ